MLAEVVSPLRHLLESLLRGVTRRTKRAASAKAISKTRWEYKCENSWSESKILLQECITLAQPRENCSVTSSRMHLIFIGVGWLRKCLTMTCLLITGILRKCAMNRWHFSADRFRGSQLRWPILDKEASAIVEVYKRTTR